MAQAAASTLDTATAAPASETASIPASRRTRIAASLDDLARLAIGTLLAILIAVAYLFWRTSRGAVDAGELDTAIATALLLATAPTWLAWMLAGALDDGATPGQERRGITVRLVRGDWRGARLVRFAIHPLSAPGWLWLAAIAYLITAFPLAWALAAIAAIVTLGGVISVVLLALGRRTLHDLIVGSRVLTVGSRVEAPA